MRMAPKWWRRMADLMGLESGHTEMIDNKKRGCGHLDRNAAYVRSDVEALSEAGGDIPRFVELDQPVEYREHGERGAILPGWVAFPGVEFSLAYRNEGHTTTPPDEIDAHLDRLERLRFDGDHYGEITVANASDILMSVGATHWRTPEEYIEECRIMGLNLKVPTGPNREPPVVNPMVTRCWVIHPHGVGPDRAGIIGYAVLTRTIYTTGPNVTADDPDVPAYAREWAETGKVSLATPAEPEDQEPRPEADLLSFGRGSDLGNDQEGYQNPEGAGEGEWAESAEKSEEVVPADPDFWQQYDIPVDFATAQNDRLSGLTKESDGTGKAADTVRHLYLLESVDEGRLQRDAERFLCKGEGERPERPSEPAEEPSEITCSGCLSLMERWEVNGGRHD